MQASPARRVRKAIPARKARPEIRVGRPGLKGRKVFKAMTGLKACPGFKGLREMMAQPVLKVRKESPVQTDQRDLRAPRACPEILVARRVPKGLLEMTARPVLKVRPER